MLFELFSKSFHSHAISLSSDVLYLFWPCRFCYAMEKSFHVC